MITNSLTYEYLEGNGYQAGGTGVFPVYGFPVAAGGEINVITGPRENYYGGTIYAGIGLTKTGYGGEAHVGGGKTYTLLSFNIFKKIEKGFDEIGGVR